MEERSTTYDENRLITFGEYKSYFTRGSSLNFVDDTKEIFNYDNIELIDGVNPDFNKVICTNDILNPEEFNRNGNTLPTNKSKCLKNIDIDYLLTIEYTFHVYITKQNNNTYFTISTISGGIEDTVKYDAGGSCDLRFRLELDNTPYDLQLIYHKRDVGDSRVYTYWHSIKGTYSKIKFTGVNWFRVTKKNNKETFLCAPDVYVYIDSNYYSDLEWVDNSDTQADNLVIFNGYLSISGDQPDGGSSGGGSVSYDALVVQSTWKTPSYLIESASHNTTATIFGLLYYDGINGTYHLLSSKNEQLTSSNLINFEEFMDQEINITQNKFYAFEAYYTGSNFTGSNFGISITKKISGGYDYLYINSIYYDKNFDVL